MKWLFLVHQVQTPNSRERVKVWRSTKKVGALLYRNSVYVLPYDKERLEDFQWVCQQIRDSNGEASVFVSEANTNEEDRQLRLSFEQKTDLEYTTLLKRANQLAARTRRRPNEPSLSPERAKHLGREFRRLRESLVELRRVDFFGSKLARQTCVLIEDVGKALALQRFREAPSIHVIRRSRLDYQNKVWATREHIHIDRLCSAWLIKRFIDPKARFVFAPESALPPEALRFDVFGEEFSHRGDRCTFETLLKVFDLKDKSLATLAEIVHDIDIKDGKFGRAEAAGTDAIVRGLSDSLKDDDRTLEVGSLFIDALYHYFTPKKGRRRPR